jgi:hypothetical protein
MTTTANASPSSERWRRAVCDYAQKINAYVEEGDRDGWKTDRAEPQHEDLSDLLPEWLEGLRRANANGEVDAFRDRWPTAHLPLVSLIEQNGQAIATIAPIGNDDVLVRVGAPYEIQSTCYRIHGLRTQVVEGLRCFGQCARRRYLALATNDRIVVRDGFDGPVVADLPLPRGDEDPPPSMRIELSSETTALHRLQPFDRGRRVLVIASDGVFVVDADGIHRLLPTVEHLQESRRYQIEESGGREEDPLSAHLSMVHGAVCPNDRYIACGHQDGPHRIFDAASLRPIGDVGPHGEYPHHTEFSAGGDFAILNACHFYNGGTISVVADALPGFNTDFYADHPALVLIEDGARVYASAVRDDEVFLGDAYGYVRAANMQGEQRWKHFVGSTISAMALSADGAVLFVATYAGFLSMIRMDAGERAPGQIGTSAHREFRRWLFWKQEPTPLAW